MIDQPLTDPILRLKLEQATDHLRDLNDKFWAITEYVNSDPDVRSHPYIHGVIRLLYPPDTCEECGGRNDIALALMCSCWSEVTEDDLPTLQAMGVEVRDPGEEDE